MQRISVRNVGPIQEAKININNLTLLIGEQASGKSTLAKLIYFFKSIKDEWTQLGIGALNEITPDHLINTIRDRFYTYFGSTRKLPEDYRISFSFDDHKKITLEGSPLSVYIEPQSWFHELVGVVSNYSERINTYRSRNDLVGETRERIEFLQKLRYAFSDPQESIYIPAGRNITVAYSETFLNSFRAELQARVQAIQGRRQDAKEGDLFITRDFITHIERVKEEFKGLGIEGYLRFFKEDIREILSIRINKLLKGKYRYSDSAGEYFLVPQGDNVRLQHASSGQQEAIRILQDVLVSLRDHATRPVFRVIEEPEAHLFPSGQRALIEILATLASKGSPNSLLLTTHSPYILTIVNNLIYASTVSEKAAIESGFPLQLQLKSESVSAYMIDNDGVATSIIDDETGLIGSNIIEDAWDDISGAFDELYALND
ncbi:MAG: AAA family ATPase [Bacteroidia bacterium]|nr:AAA family ATPase [Bacteroidia bacterium]